MALLNLAGLLVAVITIVTALAVFVAVYKRSTSQEWRDVADARLAAIKDRDSDIADLRAEQAKEIERSHKIEIDLRGQISALQSKVDMQEIEIAELKRHDVASVASALQKLGERMDLQLQSVLEQTKLATSAMLELSAAVKGAK